VVDRFLEKYRGGKMGKKGRRNKKKKAQNKKKGGDTE